MSIVTDMVQALAAKLVSVLPVDTAVSTSLEAYQSTGAAINVLVSYRDSEYTHNYCLRQRKARFVVQVDCDETELHPTLQTCVNALDRLLPALADSESTNRFTILTELVERKESTLYGVQVYEIDLIG